MSTIASGPGAAGAPVDPGDLPEARRRPRGPAVVDRAKPAAGRDRRHRPPPHDPDRRPRALHRAVRRRARRSAPPFEPPSSAHWLGLDDGGVDMVTLIMYGARVSLIVGLRGRGRGDADRRRRRHPRRLLRRQVGHRADAGDRLLPRHPGRPAHDRDRGDLGPEPDATSSSSSASSTGRGRPGSSVRR